MADETADTAETETETETEAAPTPAVAAPRSALASAK